ncbi:hypothetical protein AVEN_256529-1 [Araneus ventricosus]|uniref:Uncharacterized protein n=1 Tax=Araneus ventricosus TaxID=182803 RepID=A0A4Y2K4K4_ARAVE|nr:hypothetical protein AVEN_256529-1 [Araneus ventricosus]
MQQILYVCDDGLDKLSQIANKIGETTSTVSDIGEMLTRLSLSMLEAKVEELTNQVQCLSRELSLQKIRYRNSKSSSQTLSSLHTNTKNAHFADKAR